MSPWDQEPLHHCQGHATVTKLLALSGPCPYLHGFDAYEGSESLIS